MALKKLKKATKSDGPTNEGAADDAALYPTLWEHLSQRTYPDGESREPSILVVLAEGGRWKGCLSDKDNERTLWKVSETLDGLLTALEEAATIDDPSDWRKAAGQQGKRKRG